MRRFVICGVAVFTALLLQLTLVDRLPLGGGAPDLVLLAVTALGLTGGPVVGMLTGFWAGLALDIAPPASQLVGGRALVFCLVGYGCGQLRGVAGRTTLSSLGMAAAAVSAGEVLYVVAGLILGSPGITLAAIRLALPSTVLMDIMISPFVMYLVERASPASWPVPFSASVPSGASVTAGPLPRLRPGTGRAGSAAGGRPPLPLPSRPVRLRAGTLKRAGASRATARRGPGVSPGRLKVPIRAHPRRHSFWRPDGSWRSGSGHSRGLR
jgi:rod shape-determining protein MreD